jgi:hypothetical protein
MSDILLLDEFKGVARFFEPEGETRLKIFFFLLFFINI